jgi:urease accessory protein
MKGHLHLTVSPDDGGRTYLRQQSFKAPIHLSKPHMDEGALVVNVVNPTAGLFDGDEVDINVHVESGARLVLTTPSAGRVYRARSVKPAVVRQRIEVASGAFAEFFPELFIPQAGARYHQQTELQVAEGGQLLFCEWLSPGRVASGEVFAYEELLWDTDVFCGETLVARERYRLSPGDTSLTPLRSAFPESHYLGFFAIGWPQWPAEAVDALDATDGLWCGHGPLAAGGGTVKILCADSLSARRAFQRVREIFYADLGRGVPALRRY